MHWDDKLVGVKLDMSGGGEVGSKHAWFNQ